MDDNQDINVENKIAYRKQKRMAKRKKKQKIKNTIIKLTIAFISFISLILLIFFGGKKLLSMRGPKKIDTSKGLVLEYDGANDVAVVTGFRLQGVDDYVEKRYKDLDYNQKFEIKKEIYKELVIKVTPGKNLSNGDKVDVEFKTSKLHNPENGEYEFILNPATVIVDKLNKTGGIDPFKDVNFFYDGNKQIALKDNDNEYKSFYIDYKFIEYDKTKDKILIEARIYPKPGVDGPLNVSFVNGGYKEEKWVSYETFPKDVKERILPDKEINNNKNQ